jgi:hypothetical protein
MTVIHGFNDIDAYVSDKNYVCLKQYDDVLGTYVTVLIPLSVWPDVLRVIENEIPELGASNEG